MKQGQPSVLEEAIKPEATRKDSGRFYMNKIFGRGLERARALEGQMMAAQKPGAILRATVEPGGVGSDHRVVIERGAATLKGGQAGENPIRSSEHTFGQIEDAIRFLDDVLHGRLPEENDSKDGNSKDNGAGSGTDNGTQEAEEAEDFSSGQQPGASGEEW